MIAERKRGAQPSLPACMSLPARPGPAGRGAWQGKRANLGYFATAEEAALSIARHLAA